MEVCPDGPKCGRKNPNHFREFEHPHLTQLLQQSEIKIPDDFPQDKKIYHEQIEILKSPLKIGPPSLSEEMVNPLSMLEKLNIAEPYNIFFTSIPKSLETLKHPTSITFTDLLCPSLGTLKCSLQINFNINIDWLMQQYEARNEHQKPLTILYGEYNEGEGLEMRKDIEKYSNVTHHFVEIKDGCHHSKMGIYVYEDNSLRVVVSSANLYYEDWNHYNNGLWVSPLCPPLPTPREKDGDSPTEFKKNLLSYLRYYNTPVLKSWIDYVRKADFSKIRVFFVTSVPGKSYPWSPGCHVLRMGDLLPKHCTLPTSEDPLDWSIIAQASSVGRYGNSPSRWLRSTLLPSLAGHTQTQSSSTTNATLSMIFPTVDNVVNGYFGPESGGCLRNSKEVNDEQRWLQDYLHQWKADKLTRTRAMPHIKTYCRISPCLTKLAYFLLTSANFSSSAWGGKMKRDQGVYVRNYEVGVLLLPKFFDEEYFEIASTSGGKNEKVFPFMYDLPLTKYKSSDYPWCNDIFE